MSTPENQIEIIAERIVEAIMPSQNTLEPITRIAFKTGQWPHNERDKGGLCRASLKELVVTTLQGGSK